MNKILALLLAAALVPRALPPAASPSPVASARDLWKEYIANVSASADQVSEANYAFKPVPTVRSFGQLIGHIAGTQNYICGSILGQKTGAEDDIEKSTTTKAALVAALRASNELCAKAYALSDADAAKMIKFYGTDQTSLYAMMSNAVHDGEHYGNIVTYMRMMGMVPPSSQPAPAK